MKKIFLIGDPCIDWLVYYQSNQTPKGAHKQTKNLANNPVAIIHKLPGGVLLLKAFLKEVKEDGDELITYPDVDTDEIVKRVPTNTFAIIKNYGDKNRETMRVNQFLGYSHNANIEEKLHIEGSPSDADLIVIDDSGNDLRDQDNYWINDLNKNGKQFYIIYKLNWPLKENELLKKLVKKFDNKTIVVVNANGLREHGLEISRQLSWDKTIEDFFNTFFRDQELEDLRRIGIIIIRFSLEATMVMFHSPEVTETKSEIQKFDHYFFYDPSKYEGQMADDTSGNMKGLSHAFIAALAGQLLLHSVAPNKEGEQAKINQYNILSAITAAMETASGLLKSGYRVSNDLWKIDYPFKQIARKQENEKSELQLAGISRFMKGEGCLSLLKALSLSNKLVISSMAFDYVKDKRSYFLSKIPVFESGNFKTYDHEEIESFRSFNKLINEYLFGKVAKPLSIAVFGPPGSGKSFGVKEITGSENLRNKIKVIETNLSQLQAYSDLVTIFHESRDINLSGKIPLIFFDEFDCSYNDKPLGWIKYFLAPMQDGTFKYGEKIHPLGRAIFIFAGGICHSFGDFVKPLNEIDEPENNEDITKNSDNTPKQSPLGESNSDQAEKLKNLKVPDFISRLKGFINIKGIDKNGDGDALYSLRRGIVLRNIFDRNYNNLADSTGHINIDDCILRALLQIDKFKYGARSLEAVIAMSDLTNERSFKKSNLPSDNLLSLHLDVDKFRLLMKENKDFPAQLFEPIAKEIHSRWYKKELAKAKQPAKATLKPWSELSEDAKKSNRRQAADMPRKLSALGYTIAPNINKAAPIFKFSKDEIDILAPMEHESWNEEKIMAGWSYGKNRDDTLKIHDCLLPWEELADEVKEYDYEAVEAIPEILKGVGFRVVKLNEK